MELVKITYRFADGHVEEMEVEKEVAEAIKELDRQEWIFRSSGTSRPAKLNSGSVETEHLRRVS